MVGSISKLSLRYYPSVSIILHQMVTSTVRVSNRAFAGKGHQTWMTVDVSGGAAGLSLLGYEMRLLLFCVFHRLGSKRRPPLRAAIAVFAALA